MLSSLFPVSFERNCPSRNPEFEHRLILKTFRTAKKRLLRRTRVSNGGLLTVQNYCQRLWLDKIVWLSQKDRGSRLSTKQDSAKRRGSSSSRHSSSKSSTFSKKHRHSRFKDKRHSSVSATPPYSLWGVACTDYRWDSVSASGECTRQFKVEGGWKWDDVKKMG